MQNNSRRKLEILSHPSSELILWSSSMGRGGGVGNISTKRSEAEYCRILGEANGFMLSDIPPIIKKRNQENSLCAIIQGSELS